MWKGGVIEGKDGERNFEHLANKDTAVSAENVNRMLASTGLYPPLFIVSFCLDQFES